MQKTTQKEDFWALERGGVEEEAGDRLMGGGGVGETVRCGLENSDITRRKCDESQPTFATTPENAKFFLFPVSSH